MVWHLNYFWGSASDWLVYTEPKALSFSILSHLLLSIYLVQKIILAIYNHSKPTWKTCNLKFLMDSCLNTFNFSWCYVLLHYRWKSSVIWERSHLFFCSHSFLPKRMSLGSSLHLTTQSIQQLQNQTRLWVSLGLSSVRVAKQKLILALRQGRRPAVSIEME